MNVVPYAIALIPTVVLMGMVGAFHFRSPRCLPIWTGIFLGVIACLPIWVMETVIEDGGGKFTNLYLRAFVQQVLGAAVSEELFIFVAFIATYMLFRGGRVRTRVDIVSIAVAAAIGFTTVENLLAVIAAPQPMSAAISRLLSIVAGHASVQLVMGYFAARMLLEPRGRILNGILMIALPIAIHGWGDFSEAIFQAVDADSEESKRYFSYWIFAIFTYVVAAVIVLFQLRDGQVPDNISEDLSKEADQSNASTELPPGNDDG